MMKPRLRRLFSGHFPILLAVLFSGTLVVSSSIASVQGNTDPFPEALQPPDFQQVVGATPDARSSQAEPVITFILKTKTPTPTRTPTPINIGNFIWDDLDQDGRQDAGESGLSGITVQLWNSAKTSLIDSDVTNASGIYTVVAPTPGDYRVRVVLPAIADNFSPKDAAGDDLIDSDINPSGTSLGFTDIISLASNVISITSIDAGIIKFRTPTPTRTPTPINIGNFVWDDLDQDGAQDAGEPGLNGITVQLWNSTKTDLIDSDVTGGNGNYTVVAPVPGDYRVRVVLPSISDTFSPKDLAGGNDLLDSDINSGGASPGFTDVISLASNVISITTIDAGIVKFRTPTPTRTPTPINIGNFVWNDLNQNGVQDGGEPGLNGLAVQLWNSTKTQMIQQTNTGASGNYTVVAPIPGDYRVRVVLPVGASFTPKDQTTDTDDSDINPSGIDLGFTDVISIASNVISISSIDAGLINVPSTPTFTPTSPATATKTPKPTKTQTPVFSQTPDDSTSTPTFTPSVTLTPSLTPVGGVELLVNGGFEAKKAGDPDTPQLLPWAGTLLTKEKIKCNAEGKPSVAFDGDCAFRLVGSAAEKSKLQQTVDLTAFSFAVGETLAFKVNLNGKSAATDGKIKVLIKYNDDTPKAKIIIPLGTTIGYEERGDNQNLASTSLKLIRVIILNKSVSGKAYLDNVSLYKYGGGALMPLP